MFRIQMVGSSTVDMHVDWLFENRNILILIVQCPVLRWFQYSRIQIQIPTVFHLSFF